jgi:hypothetical protein
MYKFTTDVYEGRLGVDADVLKAEIEKTFPEVLSVPYVLSPEHLELRFLYLCTKEKYLHVSCKEASCPYTQLARQQQIHFFKKEHIIADHLKVIFFVWAIHKYRFVISPHTEQVNFRSFYGWLKQQFPREAIGFNLVNTSIYATVCPLLLDYSERVNQRTSELTPNFCEVYNSIHSLAKTQKLEHPYVRLSGDLRVTYFMLNCQHFDMRGVIFQGTQFFAPNFSLAQAERLSYEETLFENCADFRNADLRYANLQQTRFCLLRQLRHSRLDGVDLFQSNLSVQEDALGYPRLVVDPWVTPVPRSRHKACLIL